MKQLSPGRAIWHLGFRQTIKGAVIIGLLIGFLGGVQGVGYAETYPDDASRTAFAATFESAPALGLLYGETKNLASAAGYIVYRTVPVMALIAAIWGLMTAAKLLRGQEEDGRWEIVTSGSTTPRRASGLLVAGFAGSIAVAFAICGSIMIAIGRLPEINMSVVASLLVTLAIFLPAVLFAGIGMFTSQLSLTRRRAVIYGLIPLAGFFALRSVGNVLEDFHWLKMLTPFGWSDLISPVFDPQIGWLLPFILVASLFVVLSLILVSKRDLGASLIPESSSAKSRFFLLGSPAALALRQNIPVFVGWGILAVMVSILIAAVMNVAAEAVADSPSLAVMVSQLGGGSVDDLKVAFLGAGMVFVLIILLIMATVCLAGIRKDEAKNYLDNLLTQPLRRSVWLTGRLLLIVAGFTVISLFCTFAVWVTASMQNISLELWNMLIMGITLTGTVIFALGLGALLYGTLPRFAAIGMYIVIGWSFIIDIVGSVIKLDDIIAKSSLLHYVSLSATADPDWKTFFVLVLLGGTMAMVGIIAFTKRDIITE